MEQSVVIISYDPKFQYLNVYRSGSLSCYTASYHKELGLDFHYEIEDFEKEKEPQGFRLWTLKYTLDKIAESFPEFKSTEFGDRRNIEITPNHVISLLTAMTWITGDKTIKLLRDQLASERSEK